MLTVAATGSALWKNAQFDDTYNQNLASIQPPGNDYGLQYNRAQQLINISNSDTGTSQAVKYDPAGNEQSIGPASYAYSSRNHLSSGDGITYTYDGFGRRVSATATAGTRTSLYDPGMHLQSESALTTGSIAYDYIWFDNIPVAQEDIGGQTHWTATDHLGTPFIQTTSAGAVYWQADYAPLGAVYAVRTTDAHQPLRLPGQEAEEFAIGNPNGATTRFYNGFRWYRPALGRYTQADSLEYAGGAFNLYAYAGNDPLNEIDPDGLLVYIGYHLIPVPYTDLVMPDAGHAFFKLTPDDGWSSDTISGEPVNGALQNVPGQDNLEYTLPFPIAPPNGETEQEFELNLNQNTANYETNTGGSLPYLYVVQNSNSLFVGLANSVGLNGSNLLQFFPGIWFPESGHPIGADTFLPHC